MFTRQMIIFYVKNPTASASFYSKLLGSQPIEASEGFAMFALETGGMLGLWAQQDVQPASTAAAGATELALSVAEPAAVDALYQQWNAEGVNIVQTPTRMDFGYTFTAVDTDGHRLRVFAAYQ